MIIHINPYCQSNIDDESSELTLCSKCCEMTYKCKWTNTVTDEYVSTTYVALPTRTTSWETELAVHIGDSLCYDPKKLRFNLSKMVAMIPGFSIKLSHANKVELWNFLTSSNVDIYKGEKSRTFAELPTVKIVDQ